MEKEIDNKKIYIIVGIVAALGILLYVLAGIKGKKEPNDFLTCTSNGSKEIVLTYKLGYKNEETEYVDVTASYDFTSQIMDSTTRSEVENKLKKQLDQYVKELKELDLDVDYKVTGVKATVSYRVNEKLAKRTGMDQYFELNKKEFIKYMDKDKFIDCK